MQLTIQTTSIYPYLTCNRNNSSRPSQGYSYLETWGVEIGVDAIKSTIRDETRPQRESDENRYVIITNTDLPADYRFNKEFFYYITRRGDGGGFDPGNGGGGGSTTVENMYQTRHLGIDRGNGALSIPAIPLTNASGNIPTANDTLSIEFLIGGQRVVLVSYNLSGDIDLAVDAPDSSAIERSFPSTRRANNSYHLSRKLARSANNCVVYVRNGSLDYSGV